MDLTSQRDGEADAARQPSTALLDQHRVRWQGTAHVLDLARAPVARRSRPRLPGTAKRAAHVERDPQRHGDARPRRREAAAFVGSAHASRQRQPTARAPSPAESSSGPALAFAPAPTKPDSNVQRTSAKSKDSCPRSKRVSTAPTTCASRPSGVPSEPPHKAACGRPCSAALPATNSSMRGRWRVELDPTSAVRGRARGRPGVGR